MGYIGQKPSSVALTSSDIGADIINADKIADNSISEEHLDPTIITGLSELAEAPASTDEFLISDGGTLKRIDAQYVGGSAGLVHINTIDISSSTASATFLHGTNGVVLNDGTYQNFMIIGNGIGLSNDDDQLRVSISIDAGSNYNAQLYRATHEVEMTQSGSSGSNSASAESTSGAAQIIGAGGNNLGAAQQFVMYLFDLDSTAHKKYMYVEALEEQHNQIYKKRSSIINIAERAVAVDGVRFNCNSGTIASGQFRLYGINKG